MSRPIQSTTLYQGNVLHGQDNKDQDIEKNAQLPEYKSSSPRPWNK